MPQIGIIDQDDQVTDLVGHATGVQEPGGELGHLLLLLLQQVLPHGLQQVGVGALSPSYLMLYS